LFSAIRLRTVADAAPIRVKDDRSMSDVATQAPARSVTRMPKAAKGTTFFGLMAGVWGAFGALLAASPATLDDAYDWLRSLALFWEILVWIFTLPWTVAYLVYEAGWAHWARVLVVGAIAAVHLAACAPRTRA
jgi:hypothetical protein